MEAVAKWPRPQNAKDVWGLHGLTGYYHKFIPHYAHVLFPLYHTCRLDHRSSWEADEESHEWGTVELYDILSVE